MATRAADRGDCTTCPREQPWACHPGPGRRRRGFTLVELLVAAGIMSVMIVGIGVVFKAVSTASGITEADTRILENLRVLDQALRNDLENHLSTSQGLLIIRSEWAASTESAEGGVDRPVRVDRLVFTTQGQYESVTGSFTDTTGQPRPVGADAGLVFYGHGHPGRVLPGQATDDFVNFRNLPRATWTLSRRALLLGGPPDIGVPGSPGAVWYLDGLTPPIWRLQGQSGVIIPAIMDPLLLAPVPAGGEPVVPSRIDVIQDSLADIVRGMSAYPPQALPAMFARSVIPQHVTTETYRRAFAIMLDNVGDFLVEWTDGSFVDPTRDPLSTNPFDPSDTRVQWFGLLRDSNGDGQIIPFSGDTITKRTWLEAVVDSGDEKLIEQLNALRMLAMFGGGSRGDIEVASDSQSYLAQWSSASPERWQYRPKAFRIIFRLYDPALRVSASLREREAGSDRYGRRFTIVAP